MCLRVETRYMYVVARLIWIAGGWSQNFGRIGREAAKSPVGTFSLLKVGLLRARHPVYEIVALRHRTIEITLPFSKFCYCCRSAPLPAPSLYTLLAVRRHRHSRRLFTPSHSHPPPSFPTRPVLAYSTDHTSPPRPQDAQARARAGRPQPRSKARGLRQEATQRLSRQPLAVSRDWCSSDSSARQHSRARR